MLFRSVVDLEDVSYSTPDGQVILDDMTLRLGPGDRIGLVGANGVGKTTLMRLITGELSPATGRVKIGKTVKFAKLSQDVHELNKHSEERIFDLIRREKTTFMVGKKEVGTGQLLEQLGFDQQQLQTPIKDLSGGQRRRLQLLRLLFSEPNVLILDEPTNDLDTDMLAAMEDVLDSWPGTLIVVSHDRYLLERATDNQYAMLGDGKLRHLTQGVEQYLSLRKGLGTESKSATASTSTKQVLGAEKRNLEKELARLERAIAKSHLELDELNKTLGDHDPADYEGLVTLGSRQKELESKIAKYEEHWLDVAQKLQLS